MSRCIADIFEKVSADIPGLSSIEDDIAAEIGPLVESFAEDAGPELYARIQAAVWNAAYISESKGFELGMKYLAKLLSECLS